MKDCHSEYGSNYYCQQQASYFYYSCDENRRKAESQYVLWEIVCLSLQLVMKKIQFFPFSIQQFLEFQFFLFALSFFDQTFLLKQNTQQNKQQPLYISLQNQSRQNQVIISYPDNKNNNASFAFINQYFLHTYMKLLLVGAFLMVIVQSFFQEVDINAEVNDYYFMEANMKPWFGKKHLQKNDEISTVSEVQPLIWGEQNRIIVMFDVNYNAPQPAASSRSVIFVVDTGSPSTYISELTLKKITKDCEIDIDVPGKIPIEINGIPISARVSKDVNFETNVIGMDFLLSNNVQFVMKLNSEDRKKSSVSLKFGSTSQKDKKQIKQKSKGKKKSKKQK